jgi:hypothetical protein
MIGRNLVSADVQIGDNPGFAVIETYKNGTQVILERYYPTMSDLELELAIKHGLEEIISIYQDWGRYYDSIPKMERIPK